MSEATIVITAARDALHRQGEPARSPVFEGEDIRSARLVTNGSPGRTVCGQVPFVGVNAQAAAQLYPSLAACPACG